MFNRTFLPEAQFEFIVVSDTHYMLDTAKRAVEFESRRQQTARAEIALGLIGTIDAAFVVHLGDLVQEYPETAGFSQAVSEACQQLKVCGLQPYQVAGNHDVGDKPDPTMPTDWVTGDSLAGYHRRFGRSWYSWDWADCHFVVLKSQIMNSGLAAATEQQRWFEADLQGHNDKRHFVFLHLAPFLMDEQEPSLGHYDNIDQPARGWLLKLLREHRVELLFSGHSHFSFFNRVGQTRCYGAASTSFTRPGFSQLFSSEPPAEQGRNDIKKLGFYLVRVQANGNSVHFIRTCGGTKPLEDVTKQYLITRITQDFSQTPLGISMSHPVANTAQVPLAWPSIIQQPVRNDYPLLSCLELGTQRLRIQASVLNDTLQRKRLTCLQDEGLQLTAVWPWIEGYDLVAEVQPYRHLLHGVEVQLLGTLWPSESCSQQIQRCEMELGLSISLSPVIPRERVPGKQHLRTRFGYRIDELALLNERLSRQLTLLQRVLCRVDHNLGPWQTARQAPDMASLSQIKTVDWLVEFASTDEAEQAKRAAEAMFTAACQPDSHLFLGPLIDLDRTMDITYGLLDRLCNPRPVFSVVRCLNTLLFSTSDHWQPVSGPAVKQASILGLTGNGYTLWLLLPSSNEAGGVALQSFPDLTGAKELQAYDLAKGTSKTLAHEQAILELNGPMLLRVIQ